MGVVAIGGALLRRGIAAGGSTTGRSILGSIAAGLGFGAGFEAISSVFGGDGNGTVGTSAAGAIAEPGTSARFVQLEDGSRILVSKSGVPQRAQLFLPAGTKLPAGATVVSVSADNSLFGIRKARRKRPAFETEVKSCLETVGAAKRLITAVKK